MASNESRDARMRAKATGLKYMQALQRPDEPATAAQRELEGLFFRKLETLRYSGASGDRSSVHGIESIDPRREALAIRFEAGTDIQDLAQHIFPTIVTAEGEVAGIPGLRKTDHPQGTSLYRPGLPGEIVVLRVTPVEFDRAPADGVRHAEAEKPDSWTSEEKRFAKQHPGASTGLDIESALLRRIGLLNDSDAYSVRVSGSSDKAVNVELVFDEINPDKAELLQKNMTSRYLTPQIVFDRYQAPGSILLSDPGTGQTVELRLMAKPRRIQAVTA